MTAEQVWDSILSIAVYNPYPFDMPSKDDFVRVVDLDMSTVTAAEVAGRTASFDAEVGPAARSKAMSVASYRKQILARLRNCKALCTRPLYSTIGQCDRETISGDSIDPTVPQILRCSTVPFTHMMLEKGSLIYDNILKAG